MKTLQFDGLVVSDRDIIDLLESQKHKISKEKIILFLQERGIFCSASASRNDLHQYIASLNIDWFLIEDILSLAASLDENQKVTASTFDIKDTTLLDKTLENLKEEKVFAKEESVEWHCANCGHIHVGKTAPVVCPVCDHPQAHFQVRATNY